MVMRPKPTGSATQKKKIQEMLKKKKKDALKNKVKEKLKNKKKTKSTKTGLLSKAGLMPVSAPGGIPKVMSQKTAQKDLKPKRRPTPGKEIDRMPRPPKGFPDNPSILRPKNPPRKFMPMKDGGSTNKSLMDLARKLKPTGRLSTTDLERARRMLAGAFGKGKGQKPVFKTGTKEKVKGLTQKSKPMTAAQKKQLKRMMDDVGMRLPKVTRPKRGPKGMIPLMGTAAKGMRKGFGGKNMRSAARKMKRIM